MVKKIFCICSAALIAVLLPLSVSAAGSLSLADRSSTSNFFMWSTSKPSNSEWSDTLVSLASENGFSVAGWETFGFSNNRSGSVSYTWNTGDSYILSFQYRVLNGTAVLSSYGHSPNLPQGNVVGSYNVVIPIGTYDFSVEVVARTFTNESKQTALYIYTPEGFGDFDYVGFPIFAPKSASTEQGILDALGEVSEKLDDISDGLFNPTPEQSIANSAIGADIASKRDEADAILSDMSIPNISFVPSNISVGNKEEVSTVSNFVSSIPGFATISGTAVACWVAAVILYGKRG